MPGLVVTVKQVCLATQQVIIEPNERSALDARIALCFHSHGHWPGASERGRYTRQRLPNDTFSGIVEL